jgi:hypothetical protein
VNDEGRWAATLGSDAGIGGTGTTDRPTG